MGGGSPNNMNNNRRTLGNIINRVFESAGPDGKVRGTPQQIIDKYQALARDAQLAGDRVAAESFLQHSEHYTRMLGEAQAQQTETRQSFEREDGPREDAGRNDGRDDGRREEFRRDDTRRDDGYDQSRQPRQDQNAPQPQRQPQPQPQMHEPPRAPQHQPAIPSGLAMIDPAEDGEFGGLIDTPESATSAPPPNPAPMAEAAPNGAANGSHYEAAPVPTPAPEAPPAEAPKRGRPRRKAPAPRPEGEAPAPAAQQPE